MSTRGNIERIRKTVGPHVKVIAVTKNRSISEINEAIDAGINIIGENRIQEAQKKFLELTSPVKKHFIGHLQTNKVKTAVELFDMIESVDSLKLAKKIDQAATSRGSAIPIFLQVNIANDPSKYGFSPDELEAALKTVSKLPHLELRGLMTIVPYYKNPEDARPHFQKMKQLQKKYDLPELSMGMSNDYEVAAQEGATLVRISSAIFG